MGRFINPWVDRGFKHIFGQEISKVLLIDFLNDLLDGERRIVDLTFVNVELPAMTIDGRGAIFDLRCKDADGTTFIVEVQNSSQYYFHDRGLYYICRAIADQGVRGDKWKFDLCPVYGIFLMNFKSGRTNKLRTDVVLADKETGETFNDKFRQIYLEMPYFTKEQNECETPFEMWLYILNNLETLERMPFKAQKQLFERLEELAGIVNMNQQERMEYDAALKMYRDCTNVVDYARDEGIAKGRAEGLAEGEAKERNVIAINMKSQNIDIHIIALCTGLTEEEIRSL